MAPRLRPPKASDGQAARPFIPTMPHPILVWVSAERAGPAPGGAADCPPPPGLQPGRAAYSSPSPAGQLRM